MLRSKGQGVEAPDYMDDGETAALAYKQQLLNAYKPNKQGSKGLLLELLGTEEKRRAINRDTGWNILKERIYRTGAGKKETPLYEPIPDKWTIADIIETVVRTSNVERFDEETTQDEGAVKMTTKKKKAVVKKDPADVLRDALVARATAIYHINIRLSAIYEFNHVNPEQRQQDYTLYWFKAAYEDENWFQYVGDGAIQVDTAWNDVEQIIALLAENAIREIRILWEDYGRIEAAENVINNLQDEQLNYKSDYVDTYNKVYNTVLPTVVGSTQDVDDESDDNEVRNAITIYTRYLVLYRSARDTYNRVQSWKSMPREFETVLADYDWGIYYNDKTRKRKARSISKKERDRDEDDDEDGETPLSDYDEKLEAFLNSRIEHFKIALSTLKGRLNPDDDIRARLVELKNAVQYNINIIRDIDTILENARRTPLRQDEFMFIPRGQIDPTQDLRALDGFRTVFQQYGPIEDWKMNDDELRELDDQLEGVIDDDTRNALSRRARVISYLSRASDDYNQRVNNVRAELTHYQELVRLDDLPDGDVRVKAGDDAKEADFMVEDDDDVYDEDDDEEYVEGQEKTVVPAPAPAVVVQVAPSEFVSLEYAQRVRVLLSDLVQRATVSNVYDMLAEVEDRAEYIWATDEFGKFKAFAKGLIANLPVEQQSLLYWRYLDESIQYYIYILQDGVVVEYEEENDDDDDDDMNEDEASDDYDLAITMRDKPGEEEDEGGSPSAKRPKFTEAELRAMMKLGCSVCMAQVKYACSECPTALFCGTQCGERHLREKH